MQSLQDPLLHDVPKEETIRLKRFPYLLIQWYMSAFEIRH